MIEKVMSYKAEDGTVHATYKEAWRATTRHRIDKAKLAKLIGHHWSSHDLMWLIEAIPDVLTTIIAMMDEPRDDA